MQDSQYTLPALTSDRPLTTNRQLLPARKHMDASVRHDVIAGARTVVVKIGTNALSRADDSLDTDRIEHLADQVHRIRQTGRQVVLVSSGAVGAGIGLLGLKKRPDDLPHLQAAAATGQAHLIHVYELAFRRHGYHAAQILLTANDFRHRARYLNVRNTINTLFEYGVIPIVNENDTVSVKEIKFGDNDRLAAMVTNLLEDPLLIILSVIDGLFDGDPRQPGSKRIPIVDEWSESLMGLAAEVKSTRGTGGMFTKLEAVRTATAVGESVIIANGTTPAVLDRIMAGDDLGTLFVARRESIPAWKRWIGYTIAPRGILLLDAGATKAVESGGKSLLAIGVKAVEGHFEKGELVSLLDPDRVEFARGLINYDSDAAQRLAGKKTAEISGLLGSVTYDEFIHRDNLCVTR